MQPIPIHSSGQILPQSRFAARIPRCPLLERAAKMVITPIQDARTVITSENPRDALR